jgi:hypothetical protein
MVDYCLILQNYMPVVKAEPVSYSDNCITSNSNGDDDNNQVMDVKVEEDTLVEVEQNPIPITSKPMKSEVEVSVHYEVTFRDT